MTQEQQEKLRLKKQFAELYAALNADQRSAVDHIEGPSLVIAGPGTGKTHLVVTRIAHILMETDTPAQSILCLTYSDAGATAMRTRLVKIIGPEAYKITVSTYHSFCGRIIQENPDLFGKGVELQLLSDLERSNFLEDVLGSLKPDHVFWQKYKNLASLKPKLNHLFTLIKKEGWNTEDLHNKIADYTKQMPFLEAYLYKKRTGIKVAGDLKEHVYQEDMEKLTALSAGIKLYDTWQKMLSDNHRYEYDDMISWVVTTLQSNPTLKLNLQERFLYLVVDEYQDTNSAQNQIIRLLSDFWESPNVFIVGDDDQSIYEFQGARLRNLVDFHDQYKETIHTTVLKKNYRSTQAILDAAKNLIEVNKIRALPLLGLGQEKVLEAESKLTDEPELRVFDDEISEMAWIVQTIEERLAQGVPPEEIAVIYRNNKEGERISNLLRDRGIAFSTKKDVNLLKLGLVQQLLKIIHLVLAELKTPLESDAQLFQVLHAPFWGLKTIDLALILAWKRKTNSERPLRAIIQEQAFLQEAGVSNPSQMMDVAQRIEDLISSATTEPILTFWAALLNKTGALKWCIAQKDHIYWTQVVYTFTKFLEAEVLRTKNLSLGQIPGLLEGMQALNLPISLIQTAQTDVGIKLLTAHGSKGLEFDTVFVYNCLQSVWQDNKNKAQKVFWLPPNITLSGEEDSEESQRRLFYVAMTRAKRKLFLSFSRRDQNLKDQHPTQFLLETGLVAIEQTIDAEQIAAAELVIMGNDQKILVDLPKLPYIKAFVEGYVLSLSGLNQYLKCPLAFYYERILKLPDVQSEAARFGSIMHAALEHFFRKRNLAKTLQADKKPELIDEFKREIAAKKHLFSSAADYQSKLQYGAKCLEDYYEKHHASWPDKVRLETKVHQLAIDQVPVTGTIDRIDPIGTDLVRIVDYKTGSYDTAKFKEPDDDKHPHGGDYYRQGLFYKMLLDAWPIVPATASEVVFSFLGPDSKGVYREKKFQPSRDEMDWMRSLVKSTWQAIQEEEFSEGCGKAGCPYCSFYLNGELDADRNADIEALDD